MHSKSSSTLAKSTKLVRFQVETPEKEDKIDSISFKRRLRTLIRKMEKEDESFKKFLQFIVDNAETHEGKAIQSLEDGGLVLKKAKFDNVSDILANFEQWKDNEVVRTSMAAWKAIAVAENLYVEESSLKKKLGEAKSRASERNQAKASDSTSESSSVSDLSGLTDVSGVFKGLHFKDEGSEEDDKSSSKVSAGNMTYSDDNSSTYRSIVQSDSFDNDLKERLVYLLSLLEKEDCEMLKNNFLDGNTTAEEILEALKGMNMKGMEYTNTEHTQNVFDRLEKLERVQLAACLKEAFGSNTGCFSDESAGTEIGSI